MAAAEGLTGDLRQEVNTALLELDKGKESSLIDGEILWEVFVTPT